MDEPLNDAVQELKRVDHLIFVSLKYTRTVDVLKNVLTRLINAYDFMIIALLEMAKENKKITNLPKAPVQRVEEAKRLFSDDEKTMKMLDFYLVLRQTDKAEYESQNEYRRHVTMVAHLESGDVKINIDIATEHYKESKEFLEYMKSRYLPG